MLNWENTFYSQLNSFGREPVDPLFLAIADITGAGAPVYFSLQLIIAWFGVFLVLRRYQGTYKVAGLSGTIFIFGCLFILGSDAWAWRWHWFPITLAASLRFGELRGVSTGLGYAVCLCLLILSAGSLTVACVLALLLYSLILHDADRSAQLPVVMLGLLALLPALLLLPQQALPPLPSEARLSPLSPLSLYETPLIGPGLRLNTMLFERYQVALRGYTVRTALFLFVLLLGFVGGRGDWRSNEWRRGATAFIGITLAALLLLLPEWLFPRSALYWAPFPSLMRMVPGLAVASFPWVLLPFFLLGALIIVSRAGSHRGLLAQAAILSVVVVLWSWLMPERYQAVRAAHLPGERGTVISPLNLTDSPFNFVLETWGAFAGNPNEGVRRDRLYQLVSGRDFEAEAFANPNPEDVDLALDDNRTTRWSTKGPQQPGDFFELRFKKPTIVLRVVLSLAAVTTDFPRGLTVSGITAEGEQITLQRFPDWLGPLKWTEEGYPYLGPQSQVVIDFSEPVSFKVLKFIQTSSSPRYDWSIVEIGLFAEGTEGLH